MMAILSGRLATIRAMVTDVAFEVAECGECEKPAFFFGDRALASDEDVRDESYKMLREVNNRLLFLPDMERMRPLSSFLDLPLSRTIPWNLTKEKNNVPLGSFAEGGIRDLGDACILKGLRPGCIQKKPSNHVETVPANLFIRAFIAAGGSFPAQQFRSPGWIHSTEGGWWTRMVDFVTEDLGELLANSGLQVSVLATRRGIIQNYYNFFAMLEWYNPDTSTFFTPVGELGFALHEMYEVSGLPFGEIPYEEYIPGTEELAGLRETSPAVYETFWEVMCHFHICAQLTGLRGGGVKQMSWAEYLFQNLHQKDIAVTRLSTSPPKTIKARIKTPIAHYTNRTAEDIFPPLTEFESFHYQAEIPISDAALLAGFLMLWLQRCVVPTKPIESIMADMVYPAVLLAHGRPVNLLSAMVCSLQSGLRELTSEFLQIKEVGPASNKVLRTPLPRVPLPYTYLVAWFVLHCPSLMTGIAPHSGLSIPFVQRLEDASWRYSYIVRARQVVSKSNSFRILCCLPEFEDGTPDGLFTDDKGSNGYTALAEDVFRWLFMIRPGYLIIRRGNKCLTEPYQPHRFARQFGYDQLYVGNPNPKLEWAGNLYEGIRAWYYSVAGQTMARFELPRASPALHTVLAFCKWYREASCVPEYDIFTSCLKDIRELYESKRDARHVQLRGLDEYVLCEEEARAPTQILEPSEVVATPKRRAAGKRALTAEETAIFETSIRRRVTRSQSHQGPKLMEGAMRPSPVSFVNEKDGEEEPLVAPAPSLSASPGISADREDVIDVETYHLSPSTYLGDAKKALGDLMRIVADGVMKDRHSFDSYRSDLTKVLDRIRWSGGDEWHERCSESISQLETELQALRALEGVDLDVEIVESRTRIEGTSSRGTLEKDLAEKQTHVIALQGERDQILADMDKYASAVDASREAITRLEMELARRRIQLAHEEEALGGLRRRSADLSDAYQRESRELEAMAGKHATVESRLDDIVSKSVRTAHEHMIADVKARITAIIQSYDS